MSPTKTKNARPKALPKLDEEGMPAPGPAAEARADTGGRQEGEAGRPERRGPLAVSADRGLRVPIRLPYGRADRA